MPDFIAVFSHWWKRIAAFTLLATLIAVIIALVLPPKYLSVATALPASSFAADKSTVFNTNIQELYSAIGTADDLDRVIGTAHLDTIYIATVDTLNLVTHYGLEEDRNAKAKAVGVLMNNTRVVKSEWGELKIKVWDKDRNAAAQIANTLLQKLSNLHQSLRNESNRLVLQKLKEAYQFAQAADTAAQHLLTTTSAQPTATAQEYSRLLSEYGLMVATNPPVLLVVENARPALQADNIAKWASVIVTFFAAALFSFLLALYTESKKAPA